MFLRKKNIYRNFYRYKGQYFKQTLLNLRKVFRLIASSFNLFYYFYTLRMLNYHKTKVGDLHPNSSK